MTRPPVTVLMAAYNAMPHLPAAVESILNQTLTNWKMVIVNDGSSDGTTDYLASIDDPRVEVHWQENQGQQAAANHGLQYCDTEFIARMDADDISYPTRLSKQLEYLRGNPDVGLVGAQIRRLGTHCNGFPSSLPNDHDRIVSELLKNHHAMCNATVMYRASLQQEIGPYWEFRVSEDWDMFLKMSERSKLANLDDVLLDCRIHSGSVNGRRLRECMLMNLYACELSRLRRSGASEISLEQFTSRRGPLTRAMFYMDCMALAQYRVAISQLLGGHRVLGWARMAWAMASWPPRLAQRLSRILRKRSAPAPSSQNRHAHT